MAEPLALGAPAVKTENKKRSIVKAAAAKVAQKGGAVAKRAGSAALAVGRKGGALAVNVGRRAGRASKRFVQENWKTIALNEGMSLGSHVGTFFADKKAETTYLPAIENPILRFFARPSNLIAGAEITLALLTKGKYRAAFRELLRGTLHAKTGLALHRMFDSPGTQTQPTPANQTRTRGADEMPPMEGVDDIDENEAVDGIDDENEAVDGIDDENEAVDGIDDENEAVDGIDDLPSDALDERAG